MADPLDPGDPSRLILDVATPSKAHTYFECAATDLQAAKSYLSSKSCTVEVTPYPGSIDAWARARSITGPITVHPTLPPHALDTGRILMEQDAVLGDLNSFFNELGDTHQDPSAGLSVPSSTIGLQPSPSGLHVPSGYTPVNQSSTAASRRSYHASLPSIPDIAATCHQP